MTGTDATSDNGPSQSSKVRHFAAIVLVLLVFATAYRGLGITRPLVGNFSTKSVIYGMIARNWAEGRAGLFYPTMDVLVGGQRSLHMLEFSVSAQLTGALWKWFGGSLDVWGRATERGVHGRGHSAPGGAGGRASRPGRGGSGRG